MKLLLKYLSLYFLLDLLLNDLLAGLGIWELLLNKLVLSKDLLLEETEFSCKTLLVLGVDVKPGKHQKEQGHADY